MKVAVGQISVSLDKQQNLGAIADMVAMAARRGAQLITFPEASMYNYGASDHNLLPHAETLNGAFVTSLARLARENGVFIAAGMFESIPDDQHVFNTIVVLNANGDLVGHYRKIHLYDAFGWKESERISAGDGSILTFQCHEITFGIMTCYDLRFPELSRHIAASGAQAILVPAAWVSGALKETHLQTLVRARAIENNLYVIAALQVGGTFCGTSIIADPMGVITADQGEKEGLLESEIDLDRVTTVRHKSPTLKNCRPDLYAKWYSQQGSVRHNGT